MGTKMGHRASDTAEIVFDEVRVPGSQRIGREGDGFRIAMMTFDRTRIGVGAVGVGVASDMKGAGTSTLTGDPVLKKPMLAVLSAGGAVESNRKL